jgi:hypothetical protein
VSSFAVPPLKYFLLELGILTVLKIVHCCWSAL